MLGPGSRHGEIGSCRTPRPALSATVILGRSGLREGSAPKAVKNPLCFMIISKPYIYFSNLNSRTMLN